MNIIKICAGYLRHESEKNETSVLMAAKNNSARSLLQRFIPSKAAVHETKVQQISKMKVEKDSTR